MASVYQARLWGQKAAREGVSIASNPYRNPQWREAWHSGHTSESKFMEWRSDGLPA